MGCQAQVTLGNKLTFSICTHDPDTGVSTDADAAPAYRVYEHETGTPILTGTMTKLDDANTTGFYTEQITCSIGNGFEVGKSYTIYIRAVVDSDPGAIPFTFAVNTGGAGAGAIAWTITINDGSDALVDADVWATSDQAGNNLLASGTTNSNGQVTFQLDTGTVYIWTQKEGYNFTNPKAITVA